MFFAIRVSAANVWWSVRVQEDAGRQPAEGEGPVREERRGRCGGRRARGVRRQLRVLLRPQRTQQRQQQQLLRRPLQAGWWRQCHLVISIQLWQRQWRVVVARAGRRRGRRGAAADRLRLRRRAVGHPRGHVVREPGLVASRPPSQLRRH
jgi:hypothetical protein